MAEHVNHVKIESREGSECEEKIKMKAELLDGSCDLYLTGQESHIDEFFEEKPLLGYGLDNFGLKVKSEVDEPAYMVEHVNNVKTETGEESEFKKEIEIKEEPYDDSSELHQSSRSMTTNTALPEKKKIKNSLKKTIAKKSKNKNNKCSFRKHETFNHKDLKRHVMVPISVKLFYCHDCDFKSVQFTELKRHIIARHCVENPFECPDCDYKCVTSGNLKNRTLRKHFRKEPFQCLDCDYKSVRSRNLKKHIRSKHSEQNTFQCPDCDYKSVSSRTLKNHIMAKHSMQKPFQCPDCDYKSVTSGNLKMHIMSKHTGKKPFQCSDCVYKSVSSGNLKIHIMLKH